jgi:hypothetical protein
MASHDMPERVKACFDRCDTSFVMKRFTIAGAIHNHKDTFGSSTGRNVLFHWR